MILKQKWFLKFMAFFLSISYFVYLGSMKWLKVNFIKIESDKMPTNMKNIKILHISDLHSNSNRKKNLDIFKKINKLDFDMAVITGDIVTDHFSQLEPFLKDLEKLAKQVPVFFVEGNHEVFVYDEIVDQLKQIGIHVLNNERKTITVNGFVFDIIGLRDYYYLKANRIINVDSLFIDSIKYPNQNFTLVLSHQPQIFDRLKDYEPDLVLAGHTHGGQVRFPFVPTLFAPGQGRFPKYSHGLYSHKNSKLFISKGIGTTVFSIRFFNRPEISVITITHN